MKAPHCRVAGAPALALQAQRPTVAHTVTACVALWVAAASPAGAQSSVEAVPLPTPFSAGRPGASVPPGWERVKLTERKKPTEYTLVDDGGTVVVHASANAAASALAQSTRFDIRSAPVVEWRWKVGALIEAADNRIAAREDSPARLLFAFDGDKARLQLLDRTVLYMTEKLSGREAPYAMLQYVWANRLPVGTIIESPLSRRVRMVVAASGRDGVGAWQALSRNLYDDFRQAFGEEPGALIGIGILTDTDNTGDSVEAWYGDIRLVPAAR